MIALLLLAALQVDEPYQRFSTAYASLDADRVAQVYADDALMLPPGGEIKRGRDGVWRIRSDSYSPAPNP